MASFLSTRLKKFRKLMLSEFFIQAAGLVYHRRTKCSVYHQGRRAALVSHHAPACIYLRLDDMQCFALMICNSFGIDDIHAFGAIWRETVEIFTDLWYNGTKKGGESYMNFVHCNTDEKYLTLHDCVAERAYFEDGKLGFEFHDGFWISPDHPDSNLPNLVRTDFFQG